MWGLVALRGLADLSVVTGRPIELDRLNRHCGTDVRREDFYEIVTPQWLRRLIGHTDALRGAAFGRYLRRATRHADVCISAYNLMDFGKPAIQFIADFSFDDELRREFDPSPPGARSWAHRPGLLRRMYLRLARLIAGHSGYDGRDDWIIANSQWTADVLKARRGIVCRRVIYPPVACDAPEVPWEQRENGFVCLGRVSHEKRIERMINIVSRVRQLGNDVHLHIIGPIGEDAYGRMIAGKIAEHAAWCFADGSKRGREKFELLARHKYAIHGRDGEAFGIAIAEQVRSGCIPFVPDSGGPVEIVAEPSLCYRDEADAVEKIDAVLRDEARQARLREHLAERAKLFTTERFCEEFRQIVLDFARERGVVK
jgi:glycosyltransferase involved in cell wall biosynthesis